MSRIEKVKIVNEKCDAIGRMLAEVGVDVHGVILTELVSKFFASHHPQARNGLIMLFMDAVLEIIPHREAEALRQQQPNPPDQDR